VGVIEWQCASGIAREAADDVEAVTAWYRDGTDLADIECKEICVEFGNRPAGNELPEETGVGSRRTIGMALGIGAEGIRICDDLGEESGCLGEGLVARSAIAGRRGNENVLRLDQRWRTQRFARVLGTARRDVGFVEIDLRIEQRIDRVIVVAKPAPSGFSPQDIANHQRAFRFGARLGGIARGMKLHFRPDRRFGGVETHDTLRRRTSW
jgi:hypothetical protein